MRFSAAVVVLLTLGLAGVSSSAVQDRAKSTSDGVYSDAQAKRGEAAYAKSCASCHGPDLTGVDAAPSLTGPEFNAGWNDLTLDDLFERVRTTMPADAPGALTRDQYTDIIAFILSRDGFPPGSGDLPSDNPTLKQIKFTGKKP